MSTGNNLGGMVAGALVAAAVMGATGQEVAAWDQRLPGNMCVQSLVTSEADLIYGDIQALNASAANLRTMMCGVPTGSDLGTGNVCVTVRVIDNNNNAANSKVSCQACEFAESGTVSCATAQESGTTTTGTPIFTFTMNIGATDGLFLQCTLPPIDGGLLSGVLWYTVAGGGACP